MPMASTFRGISKFRSAEAYIKALHARSRTTPNAQRFNWSDTTVDHPIHDTTAKRFVAKIMPVPMARAGAWGLKPESE